MTDTLKIEAFFFTACLHCMYDVYYVLINVFVTRFYISFTSSYLFSLNSLRNSTPNISVSVRMLCMLSSVLYCSKPPTTTTHYHQPTNLLLKAIIVTELIGTATNSIKKIPKRIYVHHAPSYLAYPVQYVYLFLAVHLLFIYPPSVPERKIY